MESKCPACGASPCYVPFIGSEVECSNQKCVHYSAELYPVSLPVPSREGDEGQSATDKAILQYLYDDSSGVNPDAGDSDPNKPPFLWTWTSHHHGFGD